MEKETKSKLKLHPKPKQPIQINRPLIITVAIAVLTVLLFAIVGALTTTKRVASTPTTALTKLPKDQPLTVSPELEGLPKNYSDISTIKKFLPETKNAQLEELLQRFNTLQNEYLYLKQQLAARETRPPPKTYEDPKTQQAKQSNLVFSDVSTGVNNLVGSQAGRTSPFRPGAKDAELLPTPEQEKLFKQKARDAQKLAVMKGKDKPEDIYDLHNVVTPVSPYQILAGVSIPATLITGINTSVSGTVFAQVRQDIYDTVTGKYLLIPYGSKLVGEYGSYAVSYGQTRIAIAINRLIRPDGSSILLGKFNSADLIGQSGMPGKVNNHWARIIGAATLSTVFSIGAGIAADRGRSPNYEYPGARERAITGGVRGINQFAQNIANRSLNIRPTITLPPGYHFNVLVKKDMILTPVTRKYYGKK